MSKNLKNISKEELHSIGECLLDCIHSHKFKGGFDECCYWFNGEQPWAYHKDKYLIKVVCDLFELDYEYQLQNLGYNERIEDDNNNHLLDG